jgi:PTS system fructose-specific IIC component
MGFLVSALAGYIAFAIADRPGIAPASSPGGRRAHDAGFIGGIVGGLLAGSWPGGSAPARRRAGCAA